MDKLAKNVVHTHNRQTGGRLSRKVKTGDTEGTERVNSFNYFSVKYYFTKSNPKTNNVIKKFNCLLIRQVEKTISTKH